MATTAQVFGFGLSAPLRTVLRNVQHRRSLTVGDQALARRCGPALDATGAAGLSLYVHHAAVSVYGTVASDALREAVLSAVAAQPGVRRIVDHLVLDAGAAAAG